jgi:hypothetical protein
MCSTGQNECYVLVKVKVRQPGLYLKGSSFRPMRSPVAGARAFKTALLQDFLKIVLGCSTFCAPEFRLLSEPGSHERFEECMDVSSFLELNYQKLDHSGTG